MTSKIKVYALSTCGWCRKTVEWLKDNKIQAEILYTDKIDDPAERERISDEIRAKCGRVSFPTVLINDGETVITGYDPEAMEEKLLK